MQDLLVDLDAQIAALPERMSQVIRPWALHLPDAIALSEVERVLTYQELDLVIQTTGQWLVQRGVGPGDRVMLLGENSIALAVLILAIGDIDAWPLVVNARISEREVDAIRAHSGSRLVIATISVSPDAGRHAQRMHATFHEIRGIGKIAATAADTAVTAEPAHADGAAQVGAMIYTSGTTGTPSRLHDRDCACSSRATQPPRGSL